MTKNTTDRNTGSGGLPHALPSYAGGNRSNRRLTSGSSFGPNAGIRVASCATSVRSARTVRPAQAPTNGWRFACAAVAGLLIAVALPGCASIRRMVNTNDCQHQCHICRNEALSNTATTHPSNIMQPSHLTSHSDDPLSRAGQLKPVQYTQPMPPGCAAPCLSGPVLSQVPSPGFSTGNASQQFPPPIDASASCAQQQVKLRAETSQLQQQMSELETRLEGERRTNQQMTSSLDSVRREMNRLSEEIGYWRSETIRVERTFEEQHRHDIAALDAIVQLVEQVPEPTAATSDGRTLTLAPATRRKE